MGEYWPAKMVASGCSNAWPPWASSAREKGSKVKTAVRPASDCPICSSNKKLAEPVKMKRRRFARLAWAG